MSKRLTWVLVTFVVAVSVCARADEWRKTYSTAGKPHIRVDANDADIRVSTTDRKDIEAVVVTHGYKIGPGGVSISESQTGDRIELNLRTHSHVFSIHVRLHQSIEVQLTIPREADLDLHSGDGKIVAENLNGRVTLESGDGDILVRAGKGSFNVATGDGHVECHNFEGDLKAETKDGNARIDGVFTILDLHTGDGTIDADARAGSKMTSAWSLRSGDGSVNLGLPEGFSADVDVHTGDGHITLDFPVTVEGSLRENAIRGKINGGGQLLEIKTGDGNITVRRS